jgi:hypothetical protein
VILYPKIAKVPNVVITPITTIIIEKITAEKNLKKMKINKAVNAIDK